MQGARSALPDSTGDGAPKMCRRRSVSDTLYSPTFVLTQSGTAMRVGQDYSAASRKSSASRRCSECSPTPRDFGGFHEVSVGLLGYGRVALLAPPRPASNNIEKTKKRALLLPISFSYEDTPTLTTADGCPGLGLVGLLCDGLDGHQAAMVATGGPVGRGRAGASGAFPSRNSGRLRRNAKPRPLCSPGGPVPAPPGSPTMVA